jgi:hypothetical protein
MTAAPSPAPSPTKAKLYEHISLQFILEAETPIAHHSESIGNHQILMREKVRTPAGFREIPFITADTMRHGLREAAAYAFLDAAGLLDEGNLTEAALRLLFNGGMITGKGGDSSSVNLDVFREMCELMPHLSLLGGCARNRSIESKVAVEHAMLLCDESRHLVLPDSWQAQAIEQVELHSFRAHIQEHTRTRGDSLLSPSKRKLLSDGEQARIAGKLVAHEKASEGEDAGGREENKSTMMPRSYEALVRGSLFLWEVSAKVQGDVERDAFFTMVLAFLSQGFKVGGKKAVGCGSIRVARMAEGPAARIVPLRRPMAQVEAMDTKALAPKVSESFRQHVSDRRDRIREMLRKVDA